MSILLVILAAVFIFGTVIFVHELGHFVTAKWAGIKVNEFALGMGPTLFKIERGETTYALRLLPIGGFVSMEGEDEESSHERSYEQAPVYKRIIVIVAGAVMNILLGFFASIIYSAFVYGAKVPQWVAITLIVLGAVLLALIALRIFRKLSTKKMGFGIAALVVAALVLLVGFCGQGRFASLTIGEVVDESLPFQKDDKILSVNGHRAFIYSDIDYEFARTQNGTFTFEVLRDGEKITLENVEFDIVTYYDENGEPYIDPSTGEEYQYLDKGFKVYGVGKNFGSVISEAFRTTLSFTRLIYLSLFDLITGRAAINQLSGPVGIVSEISRAVSYGWQPVVQMLVLISVNLGVVNMLPLPALDGGKAVLLVVEGIRGKPINKKVEIGLNLVGFALLMLLMVVVSFNDIRRIFF